MSEIPFTPQRMKLFTLHHRLIVAAIATLALAACSPSTSMDHSGTNHASMSMDNMMTELEGKTGDAFDQAFIEMMIPHHQGAIDMARIVQKNAKHVEIKGMADDIISAQQGEIDMMKQWQKDWGYNQ